MLYCFLFSPFFWPLGLISSFFKKLIEDAFLGRGHSELSDCALPVCQINVDEIKGFHEVGEGRAQSMSRCAILATPPNTQI